MIGAGTLLIASFLLVSTVFADSNKHDSVREGDEHRKEVVMVGTTLEVHVNDNGKTLVRGAKVMAISGGTINATTVWGGVALNWTVLADANTQFINHFDGRTMLAEIKVGDMISFRGQLVTTGTGLSVQAETLKDWSLQARLRPQLFEGTLKTMSGTTLPAVLTVTIDAVDYTVNAAANISILNNVWLTTSLAQLHVGDHVRLYGTVTGTTIQASVVRDTSVLF